MKKPLNILAAVLIALLVAGMVWYGYNTVKEPDKLTPEQMREAMSKHGDASQEHGKK